MKNIEFKSAFDYHKSDKRNLKGSDVWAWYPTINDWVQCIVESPPVGYPVIMQPRKPRYDPDPMTAFELQFYINDYNISKLWVINQHSTQWEHINSHRSATIRDFDTKTFIGSGLSELGNKSGYGFILSNNKPNFDERQQHTISCKELNERDMNTGATCYKVTRDKSYSVTSIEEVLIADLLTKKQHPSVVRRMKKQPKATEVDTKVDEPQSIVLADVSKRHKHYDSIVKYYSDTDSIAWYRNVRTAGWARVIDIPKWIDTNEYYVTTDKVDDPNTHKKEATFIVEGRVYNVEITDEQEAKAYEALGIER